MLQCLGRWDDADAYFRQALAANRRAGAALYVAHTLRQHAGMLRARDGSGDRDEADVLLAEANEAYRQLGLTTGSPSSRPVRRPRPTPTATSSAATARPGSCATATARHACATSKGWPTLACLLAEPGREFHVLDLIGDAGDRDKRHAASGHTGEVIDAQARDAYKRRLAELEHDIDEATLHGDAGRADRATQERDALVEQLTAAYGLRGRARRGNDPVERARSTVTKQIRSAIARIDQGAPVARPAPDQRRRDRPLLRLHPRPAHDLGLVRPAHCGHRRR